MAVSEQHRQARLLDLLEPIHERAQLTARRICRSDAEGDDLFQDAALRALTRIGDLRDDRAFPAWFYRILLSLHRTRSRRRALRRLLSLDDLIDMGAEPAGDDGSRWEEQRLGVQRMRRALSRLPAAQREAVVLSDIDGYSLAEIADMQRVSLSAVKSRIARGRQRLRRHYTRSPASGAVRAPERALAEKGNPS